MEKKNGEEFKSVFDCEMRRGERERYLNYKRRGFGVNEMGIPAERI